MSEVEDVLVFFVVVGLVVLAVGTILVGCLREPGEWWHDGVHRGSPGTVGGVEKPEDDHEA